MNSNPPNPRPRRSGRGSEGTGGRGGGGGGRAAAASSSADSIKRNNKRKNQAVSSSHGASSAPGSGGGAAAALTGQGSGGGNHHSHYHHHHPHHNHQHHQGNRNPHRGGPGILWTCETGLERKCRHQATDILQHYYNNSLQSGGSGRDDEPAADDNKGLASSSLSPPQVPAKLTLEQELAMLKNEGRNHRHSNQANRRFPFSVYETKCKGIVLMLCTSPDASLWASSSTTPDAPDAAGAVGTDNPEHDDDPDAKPPGKRRCVGSTHDGTTNDATNPAPADSNEDKLVTPSEANVNDDKIPTPPWDPLETVLAVIKDARDAMRLEVALARGGDAGLPASALRPTSMGVVPSSRFVTRIIPLQITCYASVDDIQAAFKALLQRFLSTTKPSRATSSESTLSASSTNDSSHSSTATTTTTTTTYMVQSKRRHCDNLRSKDVIDGVGALVPSNWKVDLRNPDLVVWVEICTNLAGLSIVPSASLREAFQFNLLQARTASVAAE